MIARILKSRSNFLFPLSNLFPAICRSFASYLFFPAKLLWRRSCQNICGIRFCSTELKFCFQLYARATDATQTNRSDLFSISRWCSCCCISSKVNERFRILRLFAGFICSPQPDRLSQSFFAPSGTPWETLDQGDVRDLTHWEQIDNGVQFTATRKFLTIFPVVL